MQHALQTLASVFADPAAPGAPAALDALRARWGGFEPEERAALTPLAKLAAARVAAAAAAPAASEEDDYYAAMAGGDDEDPGAYGEPGGFGGNVGRGGVDLLTAATPAPVAPGPAKERTPLDDVSPEQLLGLLGLESFRPGQREAVQAALDGRDALVVMPTGGGKSLCYQLPALAGDDLTVIVSPLIALMRDQCARLTDLGHPAVMLASGGDGSANREALEQVRDGRANVVFAAPERFASGPFRAALRQRALALFVVDEAHCVSEWGHDFRPDYLRLADVIAELGHPPVMACTATATPKVAEEIVARLALREPERVRSGFDRPNLSFDVLPFDGEGSVARKRATLVAGVGMEENRPAVVYCGTRKSTEEVADLLSGSGLRVASYHAGMAADARAERQDAFMSGLVDVVVATNAFGMGVDKADVRSVWHWALPSSLEAYYQEAGRAGRDGAPGRAVLLASRSDLGRLVRFIQEAEVSVEQVGALVGRLRARAGGDGVVELEWGDDRDRVALAVAERAGALALAPGAGGRVRVELAPGELDHRLAAQLCRAATDRRWQSYRSIEKYAEGGRRLPAPAAARPLRRPVARGARGAVLRRARPRGLAAGDHRRGQAARGVGRRWRPCGRCAGRRRRGHPRRRARAAEGLAAGAGGRQAGLHGGRERGALRDRAPQAPQRGGAPGDQGDRAELHRQARGLAPRAAPGGLSGPARGRPQAPQSARKRVT